MVANVLLVSNPDRIGNIIEMTILTILFTLSCFLPKSLASILQTGSMAVVSFIAMSIPDPLSNVFAALVAILCLILVHAYGGFKTHPFWKLPSTFFGVFIFCLIASGHVPAPESEQWVRAFMWALGIMVFLFLVWLAFEEHELEVHSNFEAAVIKQNRALIEENKSLLARCKDDSD